MKFIDWFAGIGGFREGMEKVGHECVGFYEFDRFATASYVSMHCITEEQREYLSALDFKKRQKEILKDEYRNGEWYAPDIRRVYADDIPDADCWCFGFPCQDISVAGKQAGFEGNRSSLFFRVMYLLGQLQEEKRPHILFIENVKNLLSVNGGWDFARLLVEMDKAGYDAEWDVLNSKDFNVPQNRERCFIIGHLRGRCGSKVFPIDKSTEPDSVQKIRQFGRLGGKNRDNQQRYRVYSQNGIGPTLQTMKGDGRVPCVAVVGGIGEKKSNNGTQWYQQDRIYDIGCISPALSKDKADLNILCDGEHAIVRKLTPKECFRMQGWSDEKFEKAQFVNSDSQLYKQAGNGVTVSVIEAIAAKMEGCRK